MRFSQRLCEAKFNTAAKIEAQPEGITRKRNVAGLGGQKRHRLGEPLHGRKRRSPLLNGGAAAKMGRSEKSPAPLSR
jgi:hypothetical protein